MTLSAELTRCSRAGALGDALRPGVQRVADTGWRGTLLVGLAPDGRWSLGEVTGPPPRLAHGRLVRERVQPRCARRSQ